MKRLALTAAALASLSASLLAQQFGDLQPRGRSREHVSFAAEAQTVSANRQGWLELHFEVDPGYHVNSHTPKSDLLIPTSLTIQSEAGVNLGKLEYPAGTSYSFPAQPEETLDVYSGTFRVRLPVDAKPGEHTLSAVLHYQACDHAACYPPRSLPVAILFTAR